MTQQPAYAIRGEQICQPILIKAIPECESQLRIDINEPCEVGSHTTLSVTIKINGGEPFTINHLAYIRCNYGRALMEQRSRLQQRRNRLAHGVGVLPQQLMLFDTEDEDDEYVQRNLLDESPEQAVEFLSGYQQVVRLLDDALRQLEDLETDSKSEAAIEVLQGLPGLNTCVLSQYAETVSYLHTVFSEEESMHPITLTGHISADEIESRLSHYRSRGGLLLASDAGLRGFEFPDIDVVLHYDLPWSPDRLHFRIARFNRIEQQGVVRMIGLVEENAVTAKLWDKMLSIAVDLDLKDTD